MTLSAQLTTHRATQPIVMWGRLTGKQSCDECFARQQETNGESGIRCTARHTRAHGGLKLKLCSAHALEWHEQDRADGAEWAPGKKRK